MGSPIVSGLKESFRTMPSKAINGVIGRNMGERVENWLGMPLAPVSTGPMGQPEEIYQAPGAPVQNYHSDLLENARRSFLPKPAPRRMMPQR